MPFLWYNMSDFWGEVMDFSDIINNYNEDEDSRLEILINKLGRKLNQKFNPNAIDWFAQDIYRKSEEVKPISVYNVNSFYIFKCGDNELFKIDKRKYDNYNSNDSLLRYSIDSSSDDLGNYYHIYNDQFLLGSNGLYEKYDNDFNVYRYVTFDKNDNIYYDAFIDKNKGIVKKIFFDKYDEVIGNFSYSIKRREEVINKSITLNKITKFIDEEFPGLTEYEYSLLFSDLVDQSAYSIKLTNKKEKRKDIYFKKKSCLVTDNPYTDIINGFSIKGNSNNNKEDYFVITNPYVPDVKLLCVTDFVNGNKINKSLSNYVSKELNNWFNNLDESELIDEYKMVESLLNKVNSINDFLYKSIGKEKKKRKNKKKLSNKKIIGSALGLALIGKNDTYILNYGDTRSYTVKDDNLVIVTNDDTIVWDLYNNLELDYEDAINNQKGAILTDYIGKDKDNSSLRKLIKISNDLYDKLFIFSDGVTDNLSNSTLQNIIMVNEDGEILREIITQSYKNQDRHDDITGCCYIKK